MLLKIFTSIVISMICIFYARGSIKIFSRKKSKISRGERLEQELMQWKLSKELKKDFTPYKNLGELAGKLLKLQRTHGVSIDKGVRELKKSLHKDVRFEKKRRSLLTSFIFQALVVQFISLFFCGFFLSEFSPHPIRSFLYVLFFQMSGMALMTGILIFCDRSFQKDLSILFHSFMSLQSLSESTLSVREILDNSQVSLLNSVCHKKLKPLSERVLRLVSLWKSTGESYDEGMDDILDEFFFRQEVSFDALLKKLEGLKFAIMVFFFMGSYLYVIQSCLSQILIN